MIQFHIHAVNAQLQQTYFGFMAALGLGRVLVMPKVSFIDRAMKGERPQQR